MYFYRLYGLQLQTDRPLPGLSPAPDSGEPDWTIHIDGANELPGGWHSNQWDDSVIDAVNKVVLSSFVDHHRCVYYWFHIGHEDNAVDVFVAFTHRHIWVCWQHEAAEAVTLEAVSDLLAQIVLSYVLRIQGNFVLHAAAVSDGNKAFLLAAKSGTGKSSLTLALAVAGLHIVAEETAVIQETAGGFWVQPGSARLRLAPATLKAMAIAPDALTFVARQGQKRYLPIASARQPSADRLLQAESPTLIERIYWLEGRDSTLTVPLIQRMTLSEATTMLLRSRYHPFPVGAEQMAREFKYSIQMARHLALRRVQLPDGLERLQETAQTLLDDFRHQT
jgi:hypothetical protein